MKVNIDVDRLVLDGFSFHDHLRIGRAMTEELERLVRESGVDSLESREVASVDGGSFDLQTRDPKTIGRKVALAVYRRMTQ